MGILPVLILLAGKMPAPQENLEYFFYLEVSCPNHHQQRTELIEINADAKFPVLNAD